jgi:hypothetical protein
MARLADIYYGDTVTIKGVEGTWKVLFVSFIDVSIEVRNEDDTVRRIIYPYHVATHTPKSK